MTSSTAPLTPGLPIVRGRCPACGTSGLFLGNGGYVTCSLISCPEPDAASTMLEQPPAAGQQTFPIASHPYEGFGFEAPCTAAGFGTACGASEYDHTEKA